MKLTTTIHWIEGTCWNISTIPGDDEEDKDGVPDTETDRHSIRQKFC